MTNKQKWRFALIAAALLVVIWFLLSDSFRRREPAPAPAVRRPEMSSAGRAELEKFQGNWEFVSLEVEGAAKPESEFKKYTVEFKDDQWIVSEGNKIAAQTTIVLDPTAVPRRIDAYPPPGKGLPIYGIYLLEGEKLTICDRSEDNGERPTEFGTEPNSGLVLIVFTRPQR